MFRGMFQLGQQPARPHCGCPLTAAVSPAPDEPHRPQACANKLDDTTWVHVKEGKEILWHFDEGGVLRIHDSEIQGEWKQQDDVLHARVGEGFSLDAKIRTVF